MTGTRFAPGRTGKMPRSLRHESSEECSPGYTTAGGASTVASLNPMERDGLPSLAPCKKRMIPDPEKNRLLQFPEMPPPSRGPFSCQQKHCCQSTELPDQNVWNDGLVSAGVRFNPGRTGKVRLNVDPIADFRPSQTSHAQFAAGSSIAGRALRADLLLEPLHSEGISQESPSNAIALMRKYLCPF